ncbi:MAG TPA: hypothetical protein VFT51_12795 [Bacillales bacterium]|nr:hypothetical protein [Bacillales bacterium]
MIGFLIFISFILHAAAFYWILQLKKSAREGSEVEGMLSVYLDEMREENNKLIERLKNIETKETPVENKPILTSPEKTVTRPENDAPQESYSPPVDLNEKQDRIDSSVEAKALFLAEQGIDSEEIAKRLGRGKGEIDLLLRLAVRKTGRET